MDVRFVNFTQLPCCTDLTSDCFFCVSALTFNGNSGSVKYSMEKNYIQWQTKYLSKVIREQCFREARYYCFQLLI